MKQINAVATKPGETIGRMIFRIEVIRPAPSTSPASSTERGTSSRNDRIIQTASGRFIEV